MTDGSGAGAARLGRILEALSTGVLVYDAESRVRYCNAAAARILGVPAQNLIGRIQLDAEWRLLAADGRSLAHGEGPAGRVRATGQPVHDELVGFQHSPVVEPTWLLVQAVPLHGAGGQLEQIVLSFADVTELQRSRDSLQQAQDRLAATLAAVPDLLFEITRSGIIVDTQAPRADLLLRPPEQQIGLSVRDVLPPAAADVLHDAIEHALSTGFSGGRQYRLEMPGGDTRWFELSVAPKRTAPGDEPRCIVLTRDVSERRRAELDRQRLEVELRDAQKLEAIGTLAGGIAHDFNNIVAGVMGNAALVRQALPAGHAALSAIGQIETAGRRARALVEQVMAYGQPLPPQRQVVDLGGVMRDGLALLRATAPAAARLVERQPPQAVGVRGDATQLQQMFMNLCVNAWQALPAAGGDVECRVAREGDTAWLVVRDSGCGMDAATRERIFEPFFSTKPREQGTGLGLAVVHGVVRAHGGRIEVDSLPGVGTEFRIALPACDVVAGGPMQVAASPLPAPGHGEHILYVDDDEILRTLVPQLLGHAGWQVTACAGLAMVDAVLDGAEVPPSLLLSDMNMPEGSGVALARHVAQRRPGLPVVLISGFVDPALRELAHAAGVRAVVAKERLVEDLVPALAAVLAGVQREGGS